MGSSPSTQTKQQPDPTTAPTLTEKKPQIVTKTNPAQSKQTQQSSQLITDKEINNIVESVSEKPKAPEMFFVEEWCDIVQKEIQNNQTLRLIKQEKEQFNKKYIVPLKETYHKIPLQLTTFKFTYLNKYDYNDRLLILGLLSMIIGVMNMNKNIFSRPPLGGFNILKYSAFAYFFAGLFVAPEIYNPLMNE